MVSRSHDLLLSGEKNVLTEKTETKPAACASIDETDGPYERLELVLLKVCYSFGPAALELVRARRFWPL